MSWRYLIAFVVGAVVGGGAVLLFTTDLSEEKQPRPKLVAQATKGAPVSKEGALILARKFRPILRFDSDEPWRPLSVKRLFREAGPGGGQHLICTRKADAKDECEKLTRLADLVRLGSSASSLGLGRYLDLIGRRANGQDARAPDLAACRQRAPKDCDSGDGSAIYYNVTAANRRFYVDYWWFYRYNDFERVRLITDCNRRVIVACGDHEGDWEGVTVVTGDRPPYRLEYVGFASHSGVFRYPREQLETSGERPVVYIAKGSHASYPRPCSGRDCRQQLKFGSVGRPEERYDGVKRWGRNRDEDCERGVRCLQPLPQIDLAPQSSWNAFAGLWGFRCARIGRSCPMEKGPRSPSRQERYREPWCFSIGESKSCDAPTPGTAPEATAGLPTETDCEAWLGELVSVLACDRRRIALALGPSAPELAERMVLRVGRATGDDKATPGVAQLLSPPLKPKEKLTINGRASRLTRLTVRAATTDAVAEARFANVGLEDGGRATVTVGERDGEPRLQLKRPDGTVDRRPQIRIRPL